MPRIPNGLSTYAVLLITLYSFYMAGNKREVKITSWDTLGYYLYLPQLLIEKDPGITDMTPLLKTQQVYDYTPSLYQVHPTINGHHVPQYLLGMSVFYLPAFVSGHIIAHTGGYATDGYSAPYQYSMLYLNVIYIILSFILLQKVLRHFFDEGITAITLLVIYFGTNFISYATEGHGMPHTYLFFGFTIVLWYTIKWHEKVTYKNSIILGFTIGLMTTCRPTELLAILIPLLWNVVSFKDLKEKFAFIFRQHFKYTLTFFIAFIGLPLLQLVYWKLYAGEFFHQSYANPNEGFDFDRPHLFNFLFSFRKGWFIYTPVMLLAIIMLLIALFKRKNYAFAFVVFTCINIYVLSSWSNWWYATSFSQRPVIHSYPIYAICLAFGLQYCWKHKVVLAGFLSLVVCMVALNIFQFWQMHHWILSFDRMTKPYYMAVFGKTSIPPGADTLLLVDRSVVFDYHIKDSARYVCTKTILPEQAPSPAGVYTFEDGQAYSDFYIRKPYADLTDRDHAWLELSCEIKATDSSALNELDMAMNFFTQRQKVFEWQASRVFQHVSPLPDGWNKFRVYYLTPEMRNTKDDFFARFNKLKGGSYLVRNFTCKVYTRKWDGN